MMDTVEQIQRQSKQDLEQMHAKYAAGTYVEVEGELKHLCSHIEKMKRSVDLLDLEMLHLEIINAHNSRVGFLTKEYKDPKLALVKEALKLRELQRN